MAFVLASLHGSLVNPLNMLAEPSQDPDEEIVYIDANGFIRVLDTRVTGSNPEVKWVSPGGNWRDFALGDFDVDGDFEIVAIGGGDADGKLVVYDPVVASGATKPDQLINGIPWDTLYEANLTGRPELIGTGNFDDNVPGDEIIYAYFMPASEKDDPEDTMRVVVLKADSPTPTGRGWQQHLTLDFGETWEVMAVGNVNNASTDEFALVSEASQNIQVFRVDGGARRIFEYGSQSRPPKTAAIGEWEGDERPQLAWIRDSGAQLPSLIVQMYEGDQDDWNEVYTEAFEPSPRYAFFGQINNNDDEELIMIRNVPGDVNSPRMIVRAREQDDVPSELENRLDNDNGYRAGAAGDIDGDGRDEIILIRENRMLVFYEAERSDRTNQYDVSTNRRSIKAADLDRNGFVFGPSFGIDRTQIEATVESGGPTKTEVINLVNTTTADAIPFTVEVVGSPSWLTISPLTGVTPAAISLTFSSRGVSAGDYETQVLIRSSDTRVVNQPITINVSLSVTAAVLSVQPTAMHFSYICTDTESIPTRSVFIGGTPGVRYTAAVMRSPEVAAAASGLSGPIYDGYIDEENNVLVVRDGEGNETTVPLPDGVVASSVQSEWPSGLPWLSAASQKDEIPDTLTLTARPVLTTTAPADHGLVVIVADRRAGDPPGNVRLVPVSILCAEDFIHMPVIRR
jgi:hypothetical protein